MNDRDAVRDLVHRYSDAVCRRDAEQWAACWASDAVWDVFGTAIEGHGAIVDLWVQAMAGFDAVVQTIQNGTASCAGDRGTGRWYVQEHYRLASGDNGIMLAAYDDDYVRSVDGWQFARRALTRFYQGPPDLSAPFSTREAGE
jgi:ketosteroid isomerase-like protein